MNVPRTGLGTIFKKCLVKETRYMSMTTEQVLEYAQKLHESKTEVNPETEVKEEMQPENVETSEQPQNDTPASDDTTKQENVVESVNEVEAPKEDKKPSHEEQEKYAFTKLKNKERQKREKLISDYEARIKNLNEELSRFKDLQKDNFKTDEEYINYLVDKQMKERESAQLSQQKANIESEAFEEINQQRILSCFPKEEDREIYNKLINDSGKDFVELLDRADPDNAILSYLDDSDISPLLIRVLMTKPEYRNDILSKKSAYSKVIALDNLAKQLTYAKSIIDKRNSSPKVETKKPLPVVGKVAKSESSNVVDKTAPDYWNNKLRELNAARGRR